MSQVLDFLVEIGTEELPPKALRKLSTAFASGLQEELNKVSLSFQRVTAFATPRRLAVWVEQLNTQQADTTTQRRGPALQAAFDSEGNPSKAAQGFAKSCGLDSVDQLQRLQTDKGAWLVHESREAGKPAAALLPTLVTHALERLPIPKRMRWGVNRVEFVRPVHWVVMLLGDQVVTADILSVRAGRITYGHRFHAPQAITLNSPAEYSATLLHQGKVMVDFEQRKATVRAQVEAIAVKAKGKAVIDDELLDEVTSMVEWPVALLGSFEKRFLKVPAEVLITTMKVNQKYFYLLDKKNQLLPHFITVSNIDSKDMDVVRRGNERVVKPRLVDAEFFWNQDRKGPLEGFNERLKNVVFQANLGTLYDKVRRLENLAAVITPKLYADVVLARRAALLSKCDLMTDMVNEFPNLQGTMGRHYALACGEAAEVAAALEEQYQPRFAGDDLPASQTGQILAIADKLDSLCGIFASGQIPTGDKDPFGLRRAALGMLRIMVEAELDLDLTQLLEQALHNYAGFIEVAVIPEVAEQLYVFIMERLRVYYADKGTPAEIFDAVRSRHPSNPFDFSRRLAAVTAFQRLPEAESLAVANKRIANILKKSDGDGENSDYVSSTVDSRLFLEPAESRLARELAAMEKAVAPLITHRRYEDALTKMASLREAVDGFFDDVMVMVEDPALRQNRLALLAQLRGLFLRVADISRLL